MFIMNKKDVQDEMKRINDYLKKCSWMDFTFYQAHCGKIELYGAIDQTYNNYVDKYEIRVEFELPYVVSTLFEWHTDTSKPFIQLATDEEEAELNAKYKVEKGNYIFKINVEDFESPPIFIAAKKIACNIINENPFPENEDTRTARLS